MRPVERTTALLCPLLLALFPLLSLFAHNQSEVELSVLWVPLALCVVAALALFTGLVLATRRPAQASVLASLVVLAFFYYGIVLDPERGWWSLALWLALFVVVFVVVGRIGRDMFTVTVVLGVAGAVLAGPQAVSIVVYHVRHPSISAADPRLWPATLADPVASADVRSPDIYVIIPDDYARADVLKTYFHYDDTGFLHRLEKRGFVISDQSRSPYSDSESNIAAALNMDYLSEFPAVLGKRSQDVRPVKRVSQDNRAARLLTGLGYDYIHLDTDEVTFGGRNPAISPLAAPDSFISLWLQESVLRRVGGPLGFSDAANNARFRSSIRSEFSKLTASPSGTGPRFVVFHTLLPHDPYLYGGNGKPVTFPGRTEEDLANKLGRTYYLRQLRFVQRLLLRSVDRILADARQPPVIVIQADEGFQANSQPFGEKAMQEIRVKGLSAFHLPGLERRQIPDPPSTVNTLRFVFNHYFGTHYGMLDSVSYPETDYPYQFKPMRVR